MVGLYAMVLFYVFAGAMHFIKPTFYLKMMPSFIPYHHFFVFISGIIEIIVGLLLLLPAYRHLAAWSIIGLLIIVFPININMALFPEKFKGNQPLALWLRLPLQFILIWWAYQYVN